MLKNRLRYLMILLCTGAFFICFNGYYSMYAFFLSLALPVLSLLVSLPGMLTLRATVCFPGSEQPAHPAKAQSVPLHVAAVTRSLLPSGRARVQLVIKNHFTGEEQREKLEFSPSQTPQILEHKLTCGTCGYITCRLIKAQAYDLLGLFCVPVRQREAGSCQAVVLPTQHRPALGLAPAQSYSSEGERYALDKPGQDPTELFGLRDYRPGDKLSRVDWKLSQKTGGLLVREASLPLSNQPLLLVDLSGTGLENDSLMDVLMSLSGFLCEEGLGHQIGFSQNGMLTFYEVTGPEEIAPVMEVILRSSDRRPLQLAAAMPGQISRVACLCPQPDPELLGELAKRYPAARLHMICMRPWGDPRRFPPGMVPVRVRTGQISQDLEGLFL